MQAHGLLSLCSASSAVLRLNLGLGHEPAWSLAGPLMRRLASLLSAVNGLSPPPALFS